MIKIIVPATSANIGGGFDCMGLAVNIYNEIYVKSSNELKIETDSDLPGDKRNLVYRSMQSIFDLAAKKLEGQNKPYILKRYLDERTVPVYIKQKNAIPKTSGLGSSAACIVGGALAANALLDDLFAEKEIADFCVAYEGHPDNVMPALIGGVVASVQTDKGVVYSKCGVSKGIKLCVCTPSFQLDTKTSRQVLPSNYALSDVVYSLSRAVVTFAALGSGDLQLLSQAVGDKLHQPYRFKLIPDSDKIMKFLSECGGVVSYLSGAGPSIAAFAGDDFNFQLMESKLGSLQNKWSAVMCQICECGSTVERI